MARTRKGATYALRKKAPKKKKAEIEYKYSQDKIQLRSSPKKKKHPILSLSVLSSTKPKPPLFRIASQNFRLQVLENAASSISDFESSLLPHYGNRPWTCEVRLSPDPKLLFRVSTNEKIELACLPQIINHISSYTGTATPTKAAKKIYPEDLEFGFQSLLKIERIWYSPNLETFRSRISVLEHVEELDRRNKLINKCLFRKGAGNKLLKKLPPKKDIMQAGLYRFWRDGLWVKTLNSDNCPYSKFSFQLTPEQIEMCYSAALNHFDKVMYTVKARMLYGELSQGFDLLRERGRGRYDMEIPCFDTAPFKFLMSENAPWMPLVSMILGEDAVLIHKGCFLSLPGSEAQVYHQDGVHLCKERQKKCHAINVFIPLCDLTTKNGATEYCLGSHYLGHDCFFKSHCITPLASAGSPIIFDYRLGHRGLANMSDEPRPILYLTYTASGFRDAMNFSRKRYRKLGQMVSLPVSRSERAKKRAKEENDK
eukprot:CAMPEP_0172513084 /NCGR_PEP_ID=MMETSP1066-20121228/249577_1 /TAXON_ID=671091 /ORGANISM="Coscinodiscus wailesii, Strain CCMP2513" /LENGTH=482 /DNA_ID=CAMNT_0013293183 /DNA_START=20 /DNA_END=1468 /DNA_ORIENTATION=+